MALYPTPIEPGLVLRVNNTQLQNQVITPQGLNVAYLLTEAPAVSTLVPNAKTLVTSLADYRNLVGGVPTTYATLVDYLSVAAFFDNSNGAGLLQVINVRPPSDTSTLSVLAITGNYTAASYSLTINAEVINRTVALSGLATGYNALIAADIAAVIKGNTNLNSVIYIREVTLNAIELAPLVSGTSLSFVFATPTVAAAGTYLVPASGYSYSLNPSITNQPSVKDYGQSLYTAIDVNTELGYILAPGFFASNSTRAGFEFAVLLDNFCVQPKRQHIAVIDVGNPNFVNIPLYSGVQALLLGGAAVAAGAILQGNGSIYTVKAPGIPAIAPAANGVVVPVGSRVNLPAPISLNGQTASVLQSINATAAIANINAPTALELQKFVPIPEKLRINEALASGLLTVTEQSSSTEAGLYNWRDNFNSLEGHVLVAAPYQKYNGKEVSAPYVIPASAYLVALAIRVADQAGLAAPPASDQYPLASTAGPVWEVTSQGHSLLNGKGINIIKTINNQVYVMGSRTLSKQDLYNRVNNRQILSAYIRTMQLALNQGIVLRPLDSTGTQLSAIKTQMDRVSEAFYLAKLFDGLTSGDAYVNKCSNLNNPVSSLQAGIVNAESIVTQIGQIEQLRVVITETLLGS